MIRLSEKLVTTDPEKAISLAREAYDHTGESSFLKGAACLVRELTGSHTIAG